MSSITQPGDGLRLPETVRMFPGLQEAPGGASPQGKEVEGFLDLLLLLLRKCAQLERGERRP